ncbi:hypothetical protein AZH53_10205 [Methanomicrobiaceae archaeon CYW5]|nr:hypothetical protein [Methanovulcanius yangii]
MVQVALPGKKGRCTGAKVTGVVPEGTIMSGIRTIRQETAIASVPPPPPAPAAGCAAGLSATVNI